MEEQQFPSRSARHKHKDKVVPLYSQEQTPEPGATEEAGAPEDRALVQELLQKIMQETEPAAQQEEAVPSVQPMAAEPPAAAQSAARKKRRGRNLTPAAGFLLLLVMLLSGAFCGYAAMNAILPTTPERQWAGSQDEEMLNNINILVLGCDEREGDTVVRADVIMLATIRPDSKEVSVFSIPRDTRVDIAGHGKDKINHAMAYGGIPLIQQSVEGLLDVQIDHTVKVNFDGFIHVIDALGGVNLEVPCRMYKPLEAIDLLPGYQTLTGADALAFVRWRGDGTGDYGRIERQQQFLSAVTAKLKSMNLSQALGVASAMMDSIETDMSVKQMTSYGTNLIGMGAEDVRTYSFVGNSVMLHGVNYVEPDMEAIAQIIDQMQHGVPEEAAPETAEAAADGTQI